MSPQDDLFSRPGAKPDPADQPLARRMAPRSLDEFAGQPQLLGPGMALRRAIEADRLGSAVFFGPPGVGKSALARLAAARTKARVEELNAVTAGIADVKKVLEAARFARTQGQRTVVILDEIHHFNRTQQDVLLPAVEDGLLTLVGLTTENPGFYINAALLSRATAYEFQPLRDEDLKDLLRRAATDPERGLGKMKLAFDPEAEDHLVRSASGDARRLLNAVEVAALTTPPGKDGSVRVTLQAAEQSIQRRAIRYDRKSDEHYDHISAFIKSMRGTDPDATVYWMAKMLAAGEDPRFIARRIVICASEDVGNADPRALMLATAALQAVEFVGMPEARIPLAQAAVYVAAAPKSNAAYLAIDEAWREVEKGPAREVPLHLRDASGDRGSRGHGEGYLYPHDHPGHWVAQEYMPKPKVFYRPTEEGDEKRIKSRLEGLERG